MEKVLERTSEDIFDMSPEDLANCEFEFELELGEGYPEVELDENGEPIGYYTPVEVFDDIDRKFVNFYGEEGRQMVNARREEWNRTGPWHFEMF